MKKEPLFSITRLKLHTYVTIQYSFIIRINAL